MFETVWIRVRSIGRTGQQFGAIGLFLLGVYTVYQAHTVRGAMETNIFGYDVPPLLGFSEYETMLYGGIIVMMVGLGLCHKWIISGPGRY